MPQLMQMTRHVTSWLGWTPTPPCDVEEEEEPLQESSGIVTVLILYLGMAGLFAALNLCTSTNDDQVRARAKRELVAMERRQLQRLELRGRTTGLTLPPSWPATMPSLIRDVAAPRRPAVLLQEQRLRMRLLQQKEQELQDSQPWHDAVDIDEEEHVQQQASSCLVPRRQKSTFFDLPSDPE
ncbi:uncharacterized protein LOC6525002 [Drosophila yakuba]|uniref:Uncharacterized protein, isoform A n=1 Tax=Drosophila yakuba TaxID=7245 RepID=B4PXW4_DROYA|nr:uncharacterized protein LOC6525002 [Drosophila yakuba]XP_015046039.1 uncharacterized protein LOC6525002 [Drosophila yakuba]EDX01950.1 uncharacterized protein Dyak_GE17288, isoform A [Drosophila yakuba]KRK06479.1 uncharacterized protein Dyak_GE17288, isoform B [Drosophila yakuba]